jgi:hypothetical protein
MSRSKMAVLVDGTAYYAAANEAFRAFGVDPRIYRPLRITLRKQGHTTFWDRRGNIHSMKRVVERKP